MRKYFPEDYYDFIEFLVRKGFYMVVDFSVPSCRSFLAAAVVTSNGGSRAPGPRGRWGTLRVSNECLDRVISA